MSLLILFQGGPAAVVTPPPVADNMLTPAGFRRHAREMREYRQSLADEDAVIAATLALLERN